MHAHRHDSPHHCFFWQRTIIPASHLLKDDRTDGQGIRQIATVSMLPIVWHSDIAVVMSGAYRMAIAALLFPNDKTLSCFVQGPRVVCLAHFGAQTVAPTSHLLPVDRSSLDLLLVLYSGLSVSPTKWPPRLQHPSLLHQTIATHHHIRT